MTTIHRIGTTAMLILSLAAAGAPAASARPIDGYTANLTNGQSSTSVRSNPDEQTLTRATPSGTSAPVYSRQDKSIVPSTAQSTTARIAQASAPPRVVRLEVPASGFDWGDAGIGAAAGLALSMIVLGGALAMSQNCTRRARRTTALPS